MGIEEMKVTFGKFKCIATLTKYNSTIQNCLKLIDEVDGMPVIVASTAIPNEYQADDEIFIKSWAENTGVRKILIDNEIIGPVLEYISVGFVNASRHKLLII